MVEGIKRESKRIKVYLVEEIGMDSLKRLRRVREAEDELWRAITDLVLAGMRGESVSFGPGVSKVRLTMDKFRRAIEMKNEGEYLTSVPDEGTDPPERDHMEDAMWVEQLRWEEMRDRFPEDI